MNRIVVVGGGQGGFQIAASLRQEGFGGALTIIGEEPVLPYQRPPLSKAFLKDGDAERLLCRPASYYDRNDIGIHRSTVATNIDRNSREIHLSDGRSLAYDHLILATGARAAVPPIAGVNTSNVFCLRTLADAEALRSAVGRARSAVVVGGGFIGLEFAAAAIGLGLEVAVVEAAPRLMARVVSPAMSGLFAGHHARLGTRLLLGRSVRAVTRRGDRADGVELDDGTRIAADIVLLAVGVRPNVELALAAGLDVQNGILVDETLRTSDPDISALGDCAAFPDSEFGRPIRLESVQAATDQAKAIARRLAKGHIQAYRAVPWFWSDQAHWKLQIAGFSGADADEHALSDESMPVVFRFAKDRFVALESVNAPALHLAARKVLESGQALLRDNLEAAAYDLRLVAAGLKSRAQ